MATDFLDVPLCIQESMTMLCDEPSAGVLLENADEDSQTTPRDAGDQWLRRVVETSPDGIALCDLEGRLLLVNQRAAELGGFKNVDELLSSEQGAFSFLSPNCFQHAKDLIVQLVKEGIIRNAEFVAIRKDGSPIPIQVNAALMKNSDGEPIGLVSVVRDITEQKLAEQKLREAHQKAVEANRAKSDFLANMSHEIRTPMTAILGFAELMTDPESSPQEQREYLETIRRNGKLLLALIDDVLDLSKIEADKMTIEWTECAIGELLEDVLATVQTRAEQKGLHLEASCHPPLPTTIRTDPMRLRQILINLLSNAVKFTEQGAVRLEVRNGRHRRGAPLIQFAISDTGIGIDPAKLDELFLPFTQADASSTRRFGGTGLGLAISRRLANLLGGDIEVASIPGQGSTFTVSVTGGPGLEEPPTHV